MTTDLIELARRAISCTHWRWMPGMRYRYENHFYRLTEDQIEIGASVGVSIDHNCLPDFSDPATLGCLFSLVREAWKTADLAAIRSAFKDGSVVLSIPMTAAFKEAVLTGECIGGPTEAEALVAALEAAP